MQLNRYLQILKKKKKNQKQHVYIALTNWPRDQNACGKHFSARLSQNNWLHVIRAWGKLWANRVGVGPGVGRGICVRLSGVCVYLLELAGSQGIICWFKTNNMFLFMEPLKDNEVELNILLKEKIIFWICRFLFKN